MATTTPTRQVERAVQDIWNRYGSVKQELEDKCLEQCRNARAQLDADLVAAKGRLNIALAKLKSDHAQEVLALKTTSAKKIRVLKSNLDDILREKFSNAETEIAALREVAQRDRERQQEEAAQRRRDALDQSDRERIATEERQRREAEAYVPVVHPADPAKRWVGYGADHAAEMPPEVVERKTAAFKAAQAALRATWARDGFQPTEADAKRLAEVGREAYTQCP